MNVKRHLNVLLVALLGWAGGQQAWGQSASATATTYISDVKISSTKGVSGDDIMNIYLAGYTVDWQDLNRGVDGDDIHLGYKTTTDRSKAITGLLIIDGLTYNGLGTHTDARLESQSPQSPIIYNGKRYFLAPYAGNKDQYAGDLNRHAKGDNADICLFYTRDGNTDLSTSCLASITCNETTNTSSGGECVKDQYGNIMDCNKGCGSGTPYIYIHYTTHQESKVYEYYHVCEQKEKIRLKSSKDNSESDYEQFASHDYQNGVCTYCGWQQNGDDQMHLSTDEQLKNFAYRVNVFGQSVNAVVEKDIDYSKGSDTGITGGLVNFRDFMIGNAENREYQGTFDGGGHTITTFMSFNDYNAGLFGRIKNTTIKNLTVDGYIRNANQYTGGICGQAKESKFEQCTSSTSMSMTSADNSEYIGGICGYADNTSFDRCISKASLSMIEKNDCGHAGGLVAQGSDCTFTNCGFSGTFKPSKNSMFGGIAGTATASFNCCYAYLNVEGENSTSTYWPMFINNSSSVDYSSCYFVSHSTYVKNHTSLVQGTQLFHYEAADGTLLSQLKSFDTGKSVWSQRPGIDPWPVPYATSTSDCKHFSTEDKVELHSHEITCVQCGETRTSGTPFLRTGQNDYLKIDYTVGPLTAIEATVNFSHQHKAHDNYNLLSLQQHETGTPGAANLSYNPYLEQWEGTVGEEKWTNNTIKMSPDSVLSLIYTNSQMYVESQQGLAKFNWTANPKWQSDAIFLGCTTDGDQSAMTQLDIQSVNILEAGELVCRFVPAYYNGQCGMFDEINQKFVAVTGNTSSVFTGEKCLHPFTQREKADGIIDYKCCICNDNMDIDRQYYAVFRFDKNGGEGNMVEQEIAITADTLKHNLYTRNLHLFDGWKGTAQGKDITLADNETVTPSASLCDTITLSAQWIPGYIVNGQPLEAIRSNHVSRIDILDKEEHDFMSATAFQVDDITYTRETPSAWGTVCLPFAFSTPSDGSVHFYVPESMPDAQTLQLAEVTDIQAGQPVIYHMETSDQPLTLQQQSTTVVNAPSNTDGSTMNMKGTFVYTGFNCKDDDYKGDNYYGIQDDKFWLAANSVRMAPYRAIFHSTKTSEARLQIVIGALTGVDSIGTTDGKSATAYYTTDGKRLTQPQKGINLVKYTNGQTLKLIIK